MARPPIAHQVAERIVRDAKSLGIRAAAKAHRVARNTIRRYLRLTEASREIRPAPDRPRPPGPAPDVERPGG